MAQSVDPKQDRPWKSFAVGLFAGLALSGMKDDPGRALTRLAKERMFGPATPQRARARAEQPGRGREAKSPTEIPSLGWKDILWRVYDGFNEDRVMAVAAGVVFYGVLALFPAITALVSIYGLVSDPSTIREHLNALGSVVPPDALNIIGEQIDRITKNGGGKLGLASAFGILVALWSANSGMKAVFDALNVAYDEQEKRGFFKLNLIALCFTLGSIAFLMLAIGAMVVVPIVLQTLGFGSFTETLFRVLRWPVLFVVVVLVLAVLYRFGPSRREPRWRWVTPGSIVATVLWIIGSLLFSWYLSNFADYNATYGSLGAAIGMMMWLWLSAMAILVGAEINAEIEHQTAHDTTEDKANKPLGTRGATMADTVGEARA